MTEEETIQGIRIVEADCNDVEAEVRVVQALESGSAELHNSDNPITSLYRAIVGDGSDKITADLFITDEPVDDLRETRNLLSNMNNELSSLLREFDGRNDMVRAAALQDKLEFVVQSFALKQKLYNSNNPVLEGNSGEITSAMI